MKKIISLLFTVFLLLALSGCAGTVKGDDGLIKKAREEIAISDADTAVISIAGCSAVESNKLFWFISGNDYQAHTYTPIEFSVTDTDEYRFIKTYKPIKRTQDIAALLWNDGYSFLINNKSCGYIRIKNSAGIVKDIPVENIPFVYYSDETIAEYSFLNADKNPLP